VPAEVPVKPLDPREFAHTLVERARGSGTRRTFPGLLCRISSFPPRMSVA
jgi:molybdate-binding protein